MSWMDKLGNLLKQYSSGGAAAAAPATDVHAHFDQMAQEAPTSAIAEGLTAMFQSDKTPAFGEMLTTLFNNSTGEQKAGMVNQLLSYVNPSTLTQILSGAGLAGLTSGGTPQLTAEQAAKISPEVVQRLATHAQDSNPSVVESVSAFYAQHTALIKTLGGVALSVALAKVAERQRQG